MVACKSDDCDWNWNLNHAGVETQIHSRLRSTKSGTSSLKHFDGATMERYQLPNKQWERFFCRRTPRMKSCEIANGFDKKKKNVPVGEFQVKTSGYGENSGRGVYAKRSVLEGAYISLETAIKKLYFNHQMTYTIESYLESLIDKTDIKRITNYMYGYGFQADHKVSNLDICNGILHLSCSLCMS